MTDSHQNLQRLSPKIHPRWTGIRQLLSFRQNGQRWRETDGMEAGDSTLHRSASVGGWGHASERTDRYDYFADTWAGLAGSVSSGWLVSEVSFQIPAAEAVWTFGANGKTDFPAAENV